MPRKRRAEMDIGRAAELTAIGMHWPGAQFSYTIHTVFVMDSGAGFK
jgi:hypothetical protein